MRTAFLRFVFLASGLFYLVVAVGMTLRTGWATGLWMWPDGRLSLIFVGSVAAALAAGALWVGLSGRWRAAVPSIAGLMVLFALSAVFLWSLAETGAAAGVWPHALCFTVAALAAPVMLYLLRDEAPDSRPLMPLVRWSCVAYCFALAGAGAALVAQVATIFPWPLSRDSSILFGLFFLGLSIVYGMTASRGGAGAGIVAMAGFLAYDLVLLPPFAAHFSAVAPERMASLSIYTGVLVYSAIVAIVFLVSEARAGSPRPAGAT